MIDIATIRDHYSNMLDSQLIAIAKTDGHELTPQAFEILRAEFEKRGLDYSYITLAEENKDLLHQQKIEKFKAVSEAEFSKAIWKYNFEEKANGSSDEMIVAGLMERGLDEERALVVIRDTEVKLKEVISQASTRMLIGIGVCLLGIFISLYTYTAAAATGGKYFIIWGAIVFGGIQFFLNLSEKAKYNALLKNISG